MKATSLKRIGFIAVMACLLTLCFALVGCSGGSQDYSKNFQGEYELTSMEDSDGTYNEEDLNSLKSLGIECTLTLSEDKKLTFSMFGESLEGTWEAKSATECEITIDNESGTATLDGDKLSLEEDGTKMTFTKKASQSSQ